MNHKLKGIAGTYNRYDYLNERREALNELSLLLESTVEADTQIDGFSL